MSYQTIYDRLRAAGLTEAGALAMLGNWDCESNCLPYRLEGDFSSGLVLSKQYTADVDDGRIDKKQFQDGRGYGLAQWTFYSRKAGLWDFCKNYKHCSIADEAAQVEYAIKEMPSESPGLLEKLKTSSDLYQCVEDVCRKFERPAINNIKDRFEAAKRIKNEIDLDPQPVPPEPEPEPDPDPKPEPRSWPPRTIDWHCSDFPEVVVLTSVLFCRGYLDFPIGYWDGPDGTVTKATEAFQKDHGLVSDGVVGPLTWDRLLERR
jgi:hypothetical protein